MYWVNISSDNWLLKVSHSYIIVSKNIVPCSRYLLGYTVHHSVCDTLLFTTLLVVITILRYN
jgi:hypothetical protein